ncbi:hypothetical protein [Leifsonia sp. P73]|uniref:hypothetical protein n=1 Tax=Leifsonia sp. P73 TaxID=3423959 RepID=UPI003DA34427
MLSARPLLLVRPRSMPQLSTQLDDGGSQWRSAPELSASGGAVIGSSATATPPAGSPGSSPVT